MSARALSNGPDWDYDERSDDPRVAELEHAITDFLYAVDRGDFGDALHVGPADDRSEDESAFVVALRKAVR